MKYVSYILCGLLGFAGGLFAGSRVGKKKLIQRHEKEIQSIKDSRAEHDEWLLKQYGIDRSKTNSKKPQDNINKNKPEINQTTAPETVIRDYRQAAAPYMTGDAPKINKEIYMISEEEFSESTNAYQTLHYFAKDGIVADGDNNRVNHYEKLIGSIAIWGKFKDGQPVYVRNTLNGTDYEIVYLDEKWENVATPTQRAQAMNV